MKWLIALSLVFMNDKITIFDKARSSQKWYTTNDGVMGGFSSSTVEVDKTRGIVFSGRVSTQNNGGFAMARSPVKVSLDKEKSIVVVKLKGDGKIYQFRLRSETDQSHWYVQSFQTDKKLQQVSLKLADFYPSYRGRRLNLKNFSQDKITEVAILIANKKNEDFSLEIHSIIVE